MRYVSLPDNEVRPLPFYLAMEEYLARKSSEELFFMWQVAPTVIFGRNQIIEREVDLDYCRQHDIAVFRRKSGGGCVYADMSNIMLSYIVSSDSVVTTFEAYTSKVASALRSIGLPAVATGRNDVTINGKKISGNAFYHIPGRSIVHGTMLYDTDAENMARAISPSPAKLSAKGVESVRSHITTIAQNSGISLQELYNHLRDFMTDGELMLEHSDVGKINDLSLQYFNREWIYGLRRKSSLHREGRIEGVGEILIDLTVKDGRIADINLSGDFFVTGDLDSNLISILRGTEFDPQSVSKILEPVNLSEIIRGLTTEQFITLLFNA